MLGIQDNNRRSNASQVNGDQAEVRPARPGSVPQTFGILPKPERSPGSFVLSAILNTSLAVLVVILGIITKKEIDQRKYEQTLLVLPEPAPKPEPPKPVKMPPPPKIETPPPPVPMETQQQKIFVPKDEIKPEPKPEIKLEAKADALKMKEANVKLAPQPKAAILAAGPAQDASVKPKVEQVHYGALFGVQPNANTTSNKPATIMAIGNPYGGNTGKVKVSEGRVGSAGIGNGLQSGSNAGQKWTTKVASAGLPNGSGNFNSGRSMGQVQSAGLPQVQRAAIAQPAAPVEPNSTTVELTYKPAPEYTAEAKQLKIQGEVVLRVIFTANGRVQVLNVVRGLGHGLDEQAQRTVQMYRFKPATKNGKAVDLTTNITITFQLA